MENTQIPYILLVNAHLGRLSSCIKKVLQDSGPCLLQGPRKPFATFSKRAAHVSNFQLSLMDLSPHVMMRIFQNQIHPRYRPSRVKSFFHPIYKRPVSGWHWYLDEGR